MIGLLLILSAVGLILFICIMEFAGSRWVTGVFESNEHHPLTTRKRILQIVILALFAIVFVVTAFSIFQSLPLYPRGH